MKELTVDFISKKLGEYLGAPCNYSFTENGEWRDVAEYMIDNSGAFCDACEKRNPAECWKKYFELALADEEKNNTADDTDIHSLLKRCTDPETGYVHQTELLQLLDELNANRSKTRENLGWLYADSLSDADAYETEKEHFAKLEKVAARTADALRYMLESLIYYGDA